METPPPGSVGPVTFEDPLGRRVHVRSPADGSLLDVLRVDEGLASVGSFELAVRERVNNLATFRDINFASGTKVYRSPSPQMPLVLVSEHVPGLRLSQLLAMAERRGRVPVTTILSLTRQLTAAVARLHAFAPSIAHGAIGPERIVVTPQGRLVVVEHVLGAGLGQLQYSHARYWQDLGIPLPLSTTAPVLDQRTDVFQIGVVVLSLLLGRCFHPTDDPASANHLMVSRAARAGLGQHEPLWRSVGGWLARALQLNRLLGFGSALEAWMELEAVLSAGNIAVPALIETASGPLPAESRDRIDVIDLSSSPARLNSSTVSVIDDSAPLALGFASAEPSANPFRRQLIAAMLVGTVGIGATGGRWYVAHQRAKTNGTVTLTTEPAGATAIIDGIDRGTTPLTLALSAGSHTADLRGPQGNRIVTLMIPVDRDISEYVELAKRPSQRGRLEIRTDFADAQVSVDKVPLGPAPIRVDLAGGTHRVVVERNGVSVAQDVMIQPDSTASLVVPLKLPSGTPLFGWVSITAPVDVQLYERGQLLGTSQSPRLMMSAGTHNVEVVNDVLGYRSTQSIRVLAGEVTQLPIQFPMGSMALNAMPWAEVWVDGQRVGETPIGNLAVPLGPHEIRFRNPNLGEQRFAVSVTRAKPVRLSVDFRKR